MGNNKKKWDYTFEIRKDITQGSFLLSEPFMKDEFFGRSVCLIADHNKEEGTFGFIINKPTHKKLSYFVEDIENLTDYEVYYGGPVAADSLYYLHDNALNLENAKKISHNLFWGGNFEQLKVALSNNTLAPNSIKFFIGYSGWDPGQLRKEIIENAWIISPEADPKMVFSTSTHLWSKILHSMGDMYKGMASFPVDPSLN